MGHKSSLPVLILCGLTAAVLMLGLSGCEMSMDWDSLFNAVATTEYNVAVVFLKHVPPYCPDVDNGTDPNACEPWWKPEYLDDINPPRHTAQEYESILEQKVNDYYEKNAFGEVHFNFTILANPNSSDGWWDAPHNIQEYNQGVDANGSPVGLHQDGVTRAYEAIGSDLYNYKRLVTIQGYQGRSGQECCMYTPDPFFAVPGEYNTTLFTTISLLSVWVSEDQNDDLLAAILSHELGHTLGAPDQYPSEAWPSIGMGPWDLMDTDPLFIHFGGWTKWNRGWLPTTTEIPCYVGNCSITTTLDPLEYAGNNLLRVPFAFSFMSDFYEGYTAECRQKVNHDENIPEAGVLVTLVDESFKQAPAQVVGMGDFSFNTAALQPGESFTDASRQITITNLSQPGDSKCTVKAEREGALAPDPTIHQLSEQDSGQGYKVYMSYDIWIDSPMNGWDAFPDDEVVFNMNASPVPIGFGDPFWVKHENRIGFVIHNMGPGPADNVVVDVFVKQPLVVMPSEFTCGGLVMNPSVTKLVGSVTIDHMEPYADYKGFVPWTPQADYPAQVTAKIQDYLGELSHSNNQASETYFEYSTGSFLAGAVQPGSFRLEGPEGCRYKIPYMIFPFGCSADSPATAWGTTITPSEGMLDSGDALEVQFVAQPPEGSQPGDGETICLGVFVPTNDVFTQVGGLAFKARVVDASQLTCATPGEAIPLGSSVAVTGSLLPALSDQMLALEYFDPSGLSILQNTTTGQSGAYADQIMPAVQGVWTVQAFWQGNSQYAAAESPVCSFTVGSSTRRPTFTPNITANCRSGPDPIYGVVALAAPGEAVPVEGRLSDNSWFLVRLPRNILCYLWEGAGTLDGDLSGVEVLVESPTPTATPVNCGRYSTQESCTADPACTWYIAPNGDRECRRR